MDESVRCCDVATVCAPSVLVAPTDNCARRKRRGKIFWKICTFDLTWSGWDLGGFGSVFGHWLDWLERHTFLCDGWFE